MLERMFETQSLFGTGEVDFDDSFTQMSRIDLDDQAWIDYCPMWLAGDQTLFAALAERADWEQPMVKMYDREVRTPRLVARIPHEIHPVLPEVVSALSTRYGVVLDQLSAGWYRHGGDSVAFHGDRIARERATATVATISLGGARTFHIRPKTGGRSRTLSLGHGDLVVMGGTCQRTWEHAIPKVASALPRIALMFRHTYD
jgi:alkylated DNA repair dioxygenase AlkB